MTLGAALERAETSLAGRSSRRSFLGRLGRTLVVAAAGPLASVALSPVQLRRHICHEVVPEQFRFTAPTVLQGTWSRCCNHRIRRIVDCCSRSRIRINGDFSVTGYCHGGRRVFCITYQDTKIRC